MRFTSFRVNAATPPTGRKDACSNTEAALLFPETIGRLYLLRQHLNDMRPRPALLFCIGAAEAQNTGRVQGHNIVLHIRGNDVILHRIFLPGFVQLRGQAVRISLFHRGRPVKGCGAVIKSPQSSVLCQAWNAFPTFSPST